MSKETDEQSVKRMQGELADEADDMESRLEEFDEHVDDAKKKADVVRQQSTPDVDMPVGDADTEDKVPEPAQEP
ncbi:MAG TPA: hypothetical protein VMY78_00800 [Solirubrobacteraceae bacterium]|nr:hypothetical protein [Solirubrobacteraceae bacterium]